MLAEIFTIVSSFCGTCIVAGLSYKGVKETNKTANDKLQNKMDTHLAIVDEKISNLTEKVEKHNSVVERTYKLEKDQSVLQEKINVANHRINDLEMENKL